MCLQDSWRKSLADHTNHHQFGRHHMAHGTPVYTPVYLHTRDGDHITAHPRWWSQDGRRCKHMLISILTCQSRISKVDADDAK